MSTARPSWAFTRYCFTSRRLCTNQSPFYSPLPPALPALLQYYCTSIAQYMTPPRPPIVYAIHYTILVIPISCRDQRPRRQTGLHLCATDPSQVQWHGLTRQVQSRRVNPTRAIRVNPLTRACEAEAGLNPAIARRRCSGTARFCFARCAYCSYSATRAV